MAKRDNKATRLSRPLSKADILQIRDGVNQELAGYQRVEAVTLLGENDYSSLPPRSKDDPIDLLTPGTVKQMCEFMINDVCSLEVAAQSTGIPGDLARAWQRQGNQDLARGMTTRLAHFAVFVNRCEGAVQRSYIKGVRDNPLGWMGLSWLLERMWPDQFTPNKSQFKEAQSASFVNELTEMLEVAREEKPTPLPLYREEDIIDAQ